MARRRRERLVRTALVCSDSIALLAGGFLALYLRYGRLDATLNTGAGWIPYWRVVVVVAAVWQLVIAIEGLYDTDRLSWGMGQMSRMARALAIGAFVIVIATFAINLESLSRAWLIVAWLTSLAAVWIGRLAISGVLRSLRRAGRLLRPVLIIGSNAEASRLVTALGKGWTAGLIPVGCIADGTPEVECGVPVLGGMADLHHVVEERGIDTVVIASSAFSHEQVADIIAELRDAHVSVHMSSGLFEVLTSRIFVREVAGVPMITVKGLPLSPANIALKRVFDFIVAGVIILLGMPLWLIVAAGIKLTSKGPVFYRQERIGKDGKPFGMYKFRSMVQDAEKMRAALDQANEADGPIFKIKDDPRVTPFGRWMRQYSIDEFPQLLNVLRGEMSLVGPRPPLPSEAAVYEDRHWRRLEAVPGMTGLWQVSGRSDLSFEEMVRLDVFYIENWSLGFDIELLARTVPAVIFKSGAY